VCLVMTGTQAVHFLSRRSAPLRATTDSGHPRPIPGGEARSSQTLRTHLPPQQKRQEGSIRSTARVDLSDHLGRYAKPREPKALTYENPAVFEHQDNALVLARLKRVPVAIGRSMSPGVLVARRAHRFPVRFATPLHRTAAAPPSRVALHHRPYRALRPKAP